MKHSTDSNMTTEAGVAKSKTARLKKTKTIFLVCDHNPVRYLEFSGI